MDGQGPVCDQASVVAGFGQLAPPHPPVLRVSPYRPSLRFIFSGPALTPKLLGPLMSPLRAAPSHCVFPVSNPLPSHLPGCERPHFQVAGWVAEYSGAQ